MSTLSASPLLVVLDCDSTLIQDEVIELIADIAGTRAEVAAVTERAMQGSLDFTASLKQRVETLVGTPVTAFDDALRRVRVTPGACELISEVHALGGRVGVVSGGFLEVLDPLAESLNIDVWHANRLQQEHGRLTGALNGAVVDASVKAEKLTQWAERFGTPMSATVAIGDGANDLKMMEVAGLSVAFNAKPIVREHADLSVEHDLAQVIPHLHTVVAKSQ